MRFFPGVMKQSMCNGAKVLHKISLFTKGNFLSMPDAVEPIPEIAPGLKCPGENIEDLVGIRTLNYFGIEEPHLLMG